MSILKWTSKRRSLLRITSWLYCKGQEDKNLKLKKPLYGLKKAPKIWNSIINKYFLENRYLRCLYEHSLDIKTNGRGHILVVFFNVDDLMFIENCANMFDDLKKAMIQEFEMTWHIILAWRLRSQRKVFLSLNNKIQEKF